VVDNFKNTFTNFDPRFNVTVKASDRLMAYFNAAKGFRSGLINTLIGRLSGAADGITGINTVTPDSIWTYEIGAKATLLDGKLFLDSSVYTSLWKDFQVSIPTSNGLAVQANGGDARIKGIESSMTWQTPVKGLSAALSASYTDDRFKTVNPALRAAIPAFYPGGRVGGVPEWSGSIAADYNAPLAGTGLNLVGGGLLTGLGGTKNQRGYANSDTDARTELAVRAGVGRGKWEVVAYANNVFNNKTSTVALDNSDFYQPTPRTIGLRLSGGF
jgi:outer membrane receptor protein involved in Fe transport